MKGERNMAEETKETKKIFPWKKKKKKEKKKDKKKRRKILAIISVVFLLLVVVCWFAFGRKVMQLRSEAKDLVEESTTDTFKSSQTSVVYDTNGDELTKFKGEKDAYYLEYEDLPKNAVNAMISVEDQNFYKHNGVDYKGVLRAAVSFVTKGGEITQGGSTITQQLARTVFLTREVSWQRKVKEMFVAVELEKKYSKEQILEFYLNNVYFANGYYGIQAAAQGYFNKDASELTLSQTAFLCAIPNAPTMYDPLENKEKTMTRRNKILKDMYEQDKITKDQYDEAMAEEITVQEAKQTEKRNYVETYVIHCATRELMKQQGFEFKNSFDSDSEKQSYEEEYDKMYDECRTTLYNAGYHIYTSIDPDVQDQLQNNIDNALSGYTEQDDNGIYQAQASGTCIDNDTGKVVAIVGGRDQKDIGYSLNRAYQSPRQPGSSIKPLLVFAPALERGWTPSSVVNDNPMDEDDEHHVSNSGGSYSGQITLRRAVEKSSNVVTMRIYEQIGPNTALNYLEKMNFKYLQDEDYKYYTTCLGGFTRGTTSEEMAAGYATLANDGVYREPTCIVKITTSDGKEVISSETDETRVYTESAAKNMTDVLQSVIAGGTGSGAKVSGIDTAGKTGTTTSNRDGWFCGYTPYYTTAIWVGRDDNKEMASLSGASYPKSIWTRFMNAIHEGVSGDKQLSGSGEADSGESVTTAASEGSTSSASSSSEASTTQTTQNTTAATTAAPTTTTAATATTGAATTAAPSNSGGAQSRDGDN